MTKMNVLCHVSFPPPIKQLFLAHHLNNLSLCMASLVELLVMSDNF